MLKVQLCSLAGGLCLGEVGAVKVVAKGEKSHKRTILETINTLYSIYSEFSILFPQISSEALLQVAYNLFKFIDGF